MLQLDPPIPVETPDGKAMAQVLIDYGPEHDLIWVCFQDNGQCWCWQNQDVRAQKNVTYGRKLDDDTHAGNTNDARPARKPLSGSKAETIRKAKKALLEYQTRVAFVEAARKGTFYNTPNGDGYTETNWQSPEVATRTSRKAKAGAK